MHVHGQSRTSAWALTLGLVLTVALVAAEFIAGHFGHSLALVSDGWHNFSDLPSLALAWFALGLERRPPDHQKTYGYQRAGVLAAFVNALVMLPVAGLLCYEGYQRIVAPQPVSTNLMLGVGLLAFLLNGSLTLALSRGRHDLNMRAVFIHNLGDSLSNLGIVAGALLIAHTGQRLIDPLLAFLIAGMILWGAVGIISDSANILLESAPKGMPLAEVANAMLCVPGVREVHDMHIWSLGSKSHALSCHVTILEMSTSESELIARRIRDALKAGFEIDHTTIQFEHTHEPGDTQHRYYMPEPPTAPSRK
jgi:cobalt-zinc-cadmium efflux system protein